MCLRSVCLAEHGQAWHRLLNYKSTSRHAPCRLDFDTPLSSITSLIAKFQYTGPTGPVQTKSTDLSGRVLLGPCSGI